MSQSESPADKILATAAVAVCATSFTVMLNLVDYIGSNFETFMLIVSGNILIYDVYIVKVLFAMFFFTVFCVAFVVSAYLWKIPEP